MIKLKIIFICLGNYCRSPMAEAIFNHIAQKEGTSDRFEVSSAGTKNWDVGLPPDYRTRNILAEHKIYLDPDKRAQLITDQEIHQADYLIAMTKRIANDLGNRSNVFLLMDFVKNATSNDIPDPYPTDTFPQAFQMIEQGIKAFYAYLIDTQKNSAVAK
ncbi:MAG: low molecular weight protein-tyrosine-phosphatase [Chloroflexota bacterium]|nr:low molecular weight protein-tyrosine-phosphatase [Chloroflexota bacterium]